MMRRHGLASFGVILLTAAAICGGTFFFSLVNAVYYADLPYPHPRELVHVQMRASGTANWAPGLSLPDARDVAARIRSLGATGFASTGAVTVKTKGGLRSVIAGYVSSGVFSTLAVHPELGRVYSAEEDREDGPQVVVLGHALWVESFGADSSWIGRIADIDGIRRTVVGIMPRGFDYPGADLWVPIAQSEYQRMQRGRCCVLLVARRRGGISPDRLAAELALLGQQLAAVGSSGRVGALRVTAMRDYELSDSMARLKAMGFVLVGVLAAISAVSAALLLIARDLARQRDISIAGALGASRRQLLQPYIYEAAFVAIVSAMIGVIGTYVTTAELRSRFALVLPSYVQLGMDWRIVTFAVALALVVVVGAAALPAWRFSRTDIATPLRQSAGSSGSHPGGLLVSAEIAITLLLMALATLVMTRVVKENRRHLGYDPGNLVVLAARISRDSLGISAWQSAKLALETGARSAVGARDVGVVQVSTRVNQSVVRTADGARALSSASWRSAPIVGYASPSWFRTLGVRVLRGRLMTVDEDRNGSTVAVLNIEAAMELFADQDPIGRSILVVGPDGQWRRLTVVGVTAGVIVTPTVLAPPPAIYSPSLADPRALTRFYLRTTSEDVTFLESLRQALASVEPGVAPSTLSFVRTSLAKQRAATSAPLYVLGPLAVVAALAATIALFSFVAFAVTQRRGELAIRSALGATPSANLKLMGRFALAYVSAGIAAGAVGAILVSQIGASASAQFQAVTPSVIGLAIVETLVIVLCAIVFPLLNVRNIEPSTILRS